MWQERSWRPNLSSSREGIKPLCHTTARRGRQSCHALTWWTDTPPSCQVWKMVLTSEFRVYTTLIPHRTISPLVPLIMYISPLLITSSQPAGTLAPSPAPSWRTPLDLSKHHPYPSCQRRRSQASTRLYTTSLTPTLHPPTRPQSIPTSIVTTSHACGGHSPQWPCWWRAFCQASKLQCVTWQKPTELSQQPHPNGLDLSSGCKQRTSLPSTYATISGLPQQGGFMEWWWMQEQTYFGEMAWVLSQNGLMTTFSSGSHAPTYPGTTSYALHGITTFAVRGVADKVAASGGMEEIACWMVPQRNLMRIAAQYSGTSPVPPHVQCKIRPSHMQTQTSTTSLGVWGSDGNRQSQSRSGTKFRTWTSAGTCICAQSTCSRKRGSGIWRPSWSGKRGARTTSWIPKGCTENCSTSHWSSLQGELTSPTWRPYWAHSITVLSSHIPPHATPQTTFDGGSNSSASQTSQGQSQNPNPLLTTAPTQMQVRVSVWPSQSAPNGGHGSSSQGGNPRDETSNGLKPLASSCWSLAYVPFLARASTSQSMGTTGELLRDGGRDRVPTDPLTASSAISLTLRNIAVGLYTQNTSPAHRILPMHPPEGTTLRLTSSLIPSQSLMKSNLSSSTSTNPGDLVRGAMLQRLVRTWEVMSEDENMDQREIKHRKPTEVRPCQLPLPPATAPQNKRPAPYAPNLTPCHPTFVLTALREIKSRNGFRPTPPCRTKWPCAQ